MEIAERIRDRLIYVQEKHSQLRSIITTDEGITDIEYLAIERLVEILAQTIIDFSIWLHRFLSGPHPDTNRASFL